MNKILLSSVALIGLTAGAFAADLPSRRVAPAPYVAAAPVFTWTGFYVGVNAGYGFSGNGNNNNNYGYAGASPLIARGPLADQVLTGGAGLPVYGTNSRNGDGFVGGGQIGYNYQIGNWVVGIEADAQYADFGHNRNGALGGGSDTVTPGVNVAVGSPNVNYLNTGLFSRNSADWFGTVRGRLGFAWDRMLIYGTGGLAFTDSGNNNGFYGGSSIPTSFFYAGNGAAAQAGYAAAGNSYATNIRGTTLRMDDVGYAVGGGIEYAFTPNLTGKIEGLYVNFGTSGGSVAGVNNVVGVTNLGVPITQVSAGNRSKDVDFGVVRAGLNYKFNLF